MVDLADRWHQTLARAGTLDPDGIARALTAAIDPVAASDGLRAATFDGRVTTSGHADPTPSSVVRDHGTSAPDLAADRLRVSRASMRFVMAAGVVLSWVCGDRPLTWAGCVGRNAKLHPGTIRAGLDVDDDGHLRAPIIDAERAVGEVASIAARHPGTIPRRPTGIERGRASDLPDDLCCTLHLAAHATYRERRMPDSLLCQWCDALVTAADGRIPPPDLVHLMHAEDPRFALELDRWLKAG